MEVDGGVAEPFLGDYADLPLSPLPPEEDLLVLLGGSLPQSLETNFGSVAPLNCSSNPLWVPFLERFGLPVPEAFSMESLNSIACLLH